MKMQWRLLLLAMSMLLAVASGTARAQEIPLVTGEHWMKSSDEMKKAYLVGVANIVHVQLAYEGATPASDAQSILPRMVKGLKGQTLDSVRDGLTKWYAEHPNQMQRPVIETLWFEMVVPGLKKAG
jgi:hypothetical protein